MLEDHPIIPTQATRWTSKRNPREVCVVGGGFTARAVLLGCVSQRPCAHLQVGNARLAHGGGDGFDGRAERVEQLSELSRAPRFPASLHHEPGHSGHIGVEGGPVCHGGSGCGFGAGRGGGGGRGGRGGRSESF